MFFIKFKSILYNKIYSDYIWIEVVFLYPDDFRTSHGFSGLGLQTGQAFIIFTDILALSKFEILWRQRETI